MFHYNDILSLCIRIESLGSYREHITLFSYLHLLFTKLKAADLLLLLNCEKATILKKFQ